MKKTMLLIFAAAALCSSKAKAQLSMTYFYKEEMSSRTVEPIPGTGEYVMTETRYDPSGGGDNSIHFTRYNQSGIIVPGADVYIDQPGIDDRNIDINYIGGGQLELTTYYSPLGSGRVFVNNILIDINGNVLGPQNIIVSNDPNYINLYGADAVYDPVFNQIVVCGTATQQSYFPGIGKQAFVATVDLAMNPTNMMFYDSNPGVFGNDYDIATKISLNASTNRYYVTGSVNVNKGGNLMMGIRNQLIDPFTLNPVWDVPISFTNLQSEENGVDMVESSGPFGQQFCTLVNSTSGNKWWMLRIDPFTGNPLNPFIETIFSYQGYGHSIALGNSPNEVVISGMKYRAQGGSCTAQDAEADPFMATVDVSTPLGTLTNHVEYYTQIGNNTYWGLGDFYQPSSGIYPVPVYANQFADRENMGTPYSVVTPIFNNSIATFPLNTKYLDVDPVTKNGCKDLNCSYGFDFNDNPVSMTPGSNYYPPFAPKTTGETSNPYNYYNQFDCFSGYFRGDNATGVNTLSQSEINVYPNPATDKLSVELNNSYSSKNAQIALYDMAGKKIAVLFDGTVNVNTVQLTLPTNISTGIYMLQVTGADNNTITKRITVSK